MNRRAQYVPILGIFLTIFGTASADQLFWRKAVVQFENGTFDCFAQAVVFYQDPVGIDVLCQYRPAPALESATCIFPISWEISSDLVRVDCRSERYPYFLFRSGFED